MLTTNLIDDLPPGNDGSVGQDALALTVGCRFGLASVQPAAVIMQVAPRVQADVALVTSFGPLMLTDFEVRAERHVAPTAA